MIGNRTQAVLSKVHEYRALHEQFEKFYILAQKHLSPLSNQFGIELKDSGDDANVREFLVLNNRCRMRFGVRRGAERMLGKLIFERMVSEDETRHLFTIYFDSSDNATENPADKSFAHSLALPSNTYDWVGVRILEQFFADLTGDGDANQGVAATKRQRTL